MELGDLDVERGEGFGLGGDGWGSLDGVGVGGVAAGLPWCRPYEVMHEFRRKMEWVWDLHPREWDSCCRRAKTKSCLDMLATTPFITFMASVNTQCIVSREKTDVQLRLYRTRP